MFALICGWFKGSMSAQNLIHGKMDKGVLLITITTPALTRSKYSAPRISKGLPLKKGNSLCQAFLTESLARCAPQV